MNENTEKIESWAVASVTMQIEAMVNLYIEKLTVEEKRELLECFRDLTDPRELSFWRKIERLYPKPILNPRIQQVVEEILEE